MFLTEQVEILSFDKLRISMVNKTSTPFSEKRVALKKEGKLCSSIRYK